MARFVFRLQAVLRQRERAEQECQRALAERLVVLVDLQNALKLLDESAKSASDELRKNHLTGVIDLSYLAAHRRYINAMQQQGLEVAQKIVAAQRDVDAARVKLADAASARKVIDKLRERQHERWRLDLARRESAATDEIGAQIGYANLLDHDRDAGTTEATR